MSRPAAATPDAHKAYAPKSVACFVLTISDTKTDETDTSGNLIRELLAGAGHRVAGWRIVRDEPAEVARIVREAAAEPGIQAIVLTGGTGITSRDSTYEAVDSLLDKRLPGFGELFRVLSYQEIGPAAMLSRAYRRLAPGLAERLPARPGEIADSRARASGGRGQPLRDGKLAVPNGEQWRRTRSCETIAPWGLKLSQPSLACSPR
jgi:molybdenum cofactor biosynthesis protein B